MLRHTALRLISVIGYSLSLVSLILATLLMGMLRFETIFLMFRKIKFIKIYDNFGINFEPLVIRSCV